MKIKLIAVAAFAAILTGCVGGGIVSPNPPSGSGGVVSQNPPSGVKPNGSAVMIKPSLNQTQSIKPGLMQNNTLNP